MKERNKRGKLRRTWIEGTKEVGEKKGIKWEEIKEITQEKD